MQASSNPLHHHHAATTVPQSKTCIAITNVDSWMGCCIALHLACELEKKCKNVTLVCLAQKTDKLDRLKKMKNVEIKNVDLEKESTIESALKGSECMILIPELDEKRVKLATNVIKAAKKEGLKGAMMLSVLGSGSGLKELKSFHEIEDEIKKELDCHVILRKGLLDQALLLWSPVVQDRGEFLLTFEKNREFAPLCMQDFVCAIEHIVVDHCQGRQVGDGSGEHEEGEDVWWGGRHTNKTYTLTGPQTLSGEELVEELNKVVGNQQNPVQYKHVSREHLKQYFESLRKLEHWTEEIDDSRSDIHQHFGGDKGEHQFVPNEALIRLILDELELVGKKETNFVSDDLKKILDRRPHTIADFFKEEKSAFKFRGRVAEMHM